MLSLPALVRLRAQHPKAEIHIVINRSFLGVKPFLPMVDKVIAFDRELVQQGLVETDRALFEPFDRLQKMISELNQEKYDQIVNLTQNRFSGYLNALISANEKMGMSLNHKGQASFGSNWFRYLNNVVGAGAATIFNFADIFQFGLGGSAPYQSQIHLEETVDGRKEYETWRLGQVYTDGPKVVLQCLTSDEKKNWPMDRWIQALSIFAISNPRAEIIALGAPFERAKIEELVKAAAESKLKISPAYLSLEGALTLLNESDVLVTGDTSIKHLAAFSHIRILEIALGGSDIRKTGSLKADSLILTSAESCAPCSHEGQCHRGRRYCAESLTPEFVGLMLGQYLIKDWNAIRVLTEEFSDTARVFRSRRFIDGFWYAEDLREAQWAEQISSNLDRVAWKFMLDNQHSKHLATYGSESVHFKTWLEDHKGSANGSGALRSQLNTIETATVQSEQRLSRLLEDLSERLRPMGSKDALDFVDAKFANDVSQVERDLRLGRFLTEKVLLGPENGLYRYRQMQTSLNEVVLHQKIKLKLVRTLKDMIME